MSPVAELQSKTDKIFDLANKIKSNILPDLQADTKLFSERKLARLLHTTQNRVHRALQMLMDEGLLYSKVGDGTYVRGSSPSHDFDIEKELHYSPFHMTNTGNYSPYKTLKVHIPVGESVIQRNFWEKLIDEFNNTYPFVHVDGDFGQQTKLDKDIDINFPSSQSLVMDNSQYQPLDIKTLKRFGFNEKELCPQICDIARTHGPLYGVPVLRTNGAMWINREIFEKYDVSEKELKKPGDVFRIAKLIESQSDGQVMGTNYHGFQWHAANYGSYMKIEDGKINIDWDIMRSFLSEAAVGIGNKHLRHDHPNFLKQFVYGKVAIFSDYMHNYPVFKKQNDNFIMIPYPLEKGGSVAASATLGCISKNCQHLEEAHLLLAFMASKKAQEMFAELAPSWLSVRNDVLTQQKANSPFPEGAILYDFNLQDYYMFFDKFVFFELGPMINTEASKCLVGFQDIDTTLEKIKEFIS